MRVAEIEAALVRGGVARVLDLESPEETERWAAHDLAIVVEGSLHEARPLDALRGLAAEPYLDRLGGSYLAPGFAQDEWLLRYLWLIDDEGREVGTFALPRTIAEGAETVIVYSVHVQRDRRGRGIASRLLAALHSAARDVGLLGVRVRTHWVWQPAVRFYLARGAWVSAWDGEVEFTTAFPAWRLGAATETALEITLDGKLVAQATRTGSRLERFEGDSPVSRRTLAVVQAARGWPMVRSPGAWSDRGHDVTGPEACAAALDAMARLARSRGWDVRAPAVL